MGLGAGLLAAAGAPAQPAAAPAPAATASAVQPLPLAEVLPQADDDERLLRRLRDRAAAAEAASDADAALDAIERRVDERLRSPRPDELRRLPAPRLESLARQWAFEARQLAAWRAALRQRDGPDAGDAAEVAHRRAVWAATVAALQAAQAPPALADRAVALDAALADAGRTLAARLDTRVALERRAGRVAERIDAGRAGVGAAIDDIDRRLLQLDAPPLWRGPPEDDASDRRALRTGVRAELAFAREYAALAGVNRGAASAVQLALLLVLGWLVVARRAAARRHPEAPPAPLDETAVRVVQRPLSAWLLLAMVAVLVLEPDGPMLAAEVAMLIAVVPVLRLLPMPHTPALRRAVGLVAALYVLRSLGQLVAAEGGSYRLVLLGTTTVALAAALWLWRALARPSGDAAPQEAGLRRRVRPLAALASTLLAVALAANVAGNVSLAEMLGRAVVDGAYAGLLLSAGLAVSLTLLQVLLAQPRVAASRLVHEHGPAFLRWMARWLGRAAFVGWAVYALDLLRLLRPLSAWAAAVLTHRVEVGEIAISLGDVLVFGVSMLLATWVARATRALLRDRLAGHAELPRGVGHSVASLSFHGVLLLGFLVALSAAGFKVGQLALVFGALGVGIGLGLQAIVNNVVSGLVLMVERPIQPGDVVEVSGVSGRVRSIGLRSTTLRSFEGADIVVPNGTLLAANLVNWTLHDRSRRVDLQVGVAYGSDPDAVIALLERVARATPGLADTPAPRAMLQGYGDSALEFVLRGWTPEFDDWAALRSELHRRVLQALAEAGIEIPFNQLDLHLRGVDGDAAAGAALRPPPA